MTNLSSALSLVNIKSAIIATPVFASKVVSEFAAVDGGKVQDMIDAGGLMLALGLALMMYRNSEQRREREKERYDEKLRENEEAYNSKLAVMEEKNERIVAVEKEAKHEAYEQRNKLIAENSLLLSRCSNCVGNELRLQHDPSGTKLLEDVNNHLIVGASKPTK